MPASRARPGPGANRLIMMLPSASRERLLPNLHPVRFELGQTVIAQDTRIEHAYFSTGVVFSLVV